MIFFTPSRSGVRQKMLSCLPHNDVLLRPAVATYLLQFSERPEIVDSQEMAAVRCVYILVVFVIAQRLINILTCILAVCIYQLL